MLLLMMNSFMLFGFGLIWCQVLTDQDLSHRVSNDCHDGALAGSNSSGWFGKKRDDSEEAFIRSFCRTIIVSHSCHFRSRNYLQRSFLASLPDRMYFADTADTPSSSSLSSSTPSASSLSAASSSTSLAQDLMRLLESFKSESSRHLFIKHAAPSRIPQV